jgi:hypothetical protein
VTSLKNSSKANHLYYHYRRFDNTAASYANYDVWAWNNETGSEGFRFDWAGRTTPSNGVDAATGDATVDKIGGAYVDIDLSAPIMADGMPPAGRWVAIVSPSCRMGWCANPWDYRSS